MKIAQINNQCNGSTGMLMRLLSKAMTENGIVNHMYFTAGICDDPLATKYSSKKEVKLNALRSRILGNYGFNSNAATKRLIQHLEEFKPDLVHIHNIHGHDVNIETLYRYLASKKIPVIHTLHDCWEFTGYCPHYSITDCFKWQNQCHDCPARKTYSWFIDNSQSNYQRKKTASLSIRDYFLVTPSYWLKQEVSKSFLQSKQCFVIANGIDSDIFKDRPSNLKQKLGIEDKKVILNVAMTVSSSKGIDDIKTLCKMLPDSYRIVLVGVPKEHLHDFPEQIIACPRTENKEQLAEFYSAADVFLNPTHQDTFPTVNLEAMSCGTPVVTYNVGGSPESLTSDTGVIVPENNLEELMNAVLKVAQNKEQMKKACRTQVLMNYTQEKYTADYIKLYYELANSTKNDAYVSI